MFIKINFTKNPKLYQQSNFKFLSYFLFFVFNISSFMVFGFFPCTSLVLLVISLLTLYSKF